MACFPPGLKLSRFLAGLRPVEYAGDNLPVRRLARAQRGDPARAVVELGDRL